MAWAVSLVFLKWTKGQHTSSLAGFSVIDRLSSLEYFTMAAYFGTFTVGEKWYMALGLVTITGHFSSHVIAYLIYFFFPI